MPSKQEWGQLTQKLGLAAAGGGLLGSGVQDFVTGGGMADAGTPATLGGKIKRAATGAAMAVSPAFREGMETMTSSRLNIAQAEQAQEESLKLKREREEMETPFDIGSLITGVDQTGTLLPIVQKYFDDKRIDINQDGKTTRGEVLKAAEDGRLDYGEIAELMEESIITSRDNINVNKRAVNDQLKKLNEKKGLLGGNRITRKTFEVNQSLAQENTAVARLIQDEIDAQGQLDQLIATQTGFVNEGKQQKIEWSQQKIVNQMLTRKSVREDIKDAEQWIRQIRNSETKNNNGQNFITVRGEELTEQEVIDGLEDMYPQMGSWIRNRLSQVSDRGEELL